MKTSATYFLLLIILFWAREIYLMFFPNDSAKLIDKHLEFLRWWRPHYPFELSISKWSNLKKYKFYTELVSILLNFQRTYGHCPKICFAHIRDGLFKQKDFDTKLKRINHNGIVQFILVTIIVWFMVAMSIESLSWSPPAELLVLLILLQLVGIIFYKLCSIFMERRVFKGVDARLRVFYTFLCLYKGQLAYQEVIGQSGIKTLENLTKQQKEELANMLERWQKLGQGIEEDILELLAQTWLNLSHGLEQFLQLLGAIRLFTLVFFFLSSYFCFLAYLMNTLI